MSLKFCTKCGEELKQGSKFCTKCGNPIQNASSEKDESNNCQQRDYSSEIKELTDKCASLQKQVDELKTLIKPNKRQVDEPKEVSNSSNYDDKPKRNNLFVLSNKNTLFIIAVILMINVVSAFIIPWIFSQEGPVYGIGSGLLLLFDGIVCFIYSIIFLLNNLLTKQLKELGSKVMGVFVILFMVTSFGLTVASSLVMLITIHDVLPLKIISALLLSATYLAPTVVILCARKKK